MCWLGVLRSRLVIPVDKEKHPFSSLGNAKICSQKSLGVNETVSSLVESVAELVEQTAIVPADEGRNLLHNCIASAEFADMLDEAKHETIAWIVSELEAHLADALARRSADYGIDALPHGDDVWIIGAEGFAQGATLIDREIKAKAFAISEICGMDRFVFRLVVSGNPNVESRLLETEAQTAHSCKEVDSGAAAGLWGQGHDESRF